MADAPGEDDASARAALEQTVKRLSVAVSKYRKKCASTADLLARRTEEAAAEKGLLEGRLAAALEKLESAQAAAALYKHRADAHEKGCRDVSWWARRQASFLCAETALRVAASRVEVRADKAKATRAIA